MTPDRSTPKNALMTADIDEPSMKETLWHKLRADLSLYVPEISNSELLMCCCCGRFLSQEQFSLEHIVPKQALADDPVQVRVHPEAPVNARSELTLLCKKNLYIKGQKFSSAGCNSWKGRFYDGCIREALNGTTLNTKVK